MFLVAYTKYINQTKPIYLLQLAYDMYIYIKAIHIYIVHLRNNCFQMVTNERQHRTLKPPIPKDGLDLTTQLAGCIK